MLMTPCEVLFSMAVAKMKPVAASTAVHIPTLPDAERGIESKSMCSLSPSRNAGGNS